ncbi:MAG TPA: IPT/TIG domain-containing protein [Anaerolineae bacterium]|nr:IPT/TIG domain-containing protein [Anaerolineae bacterium]
MTGTRSISIVLVRLAALVALVLAVLPVMPPNATVPEAAAQATTTNTLTLRVVSARDEPRAFDGVGVAKGAAVTNYKWLISVDNTGDANPTSDPNCHPYLNPPANTIRNPNYPDLCNWAGVRTAPGWAPVYTQGDQNDLDLDTGITLPAGKYLISVMADGYKVDGEHFTVPLPAPGLVEVQAQPLPLPPATMVIRVFNDQSMTNGQFDAPGEQGLAGFRASINDMLGEITADMFGNPLCTVYQKDADGNVVYDADGAPIVETLGNGCYSDANGDIIIPNLGTIRFDVLVIPPDGQDWIQTTTLEGSQGWDTWLQEAGTGLDNEFVVAGEPFPWTVFGFVQPRTPNLGGTGTIQGVIMGAITASPAQGGLPFQGATWGGFAGTQLDTPIANPWLSLNDLQNGDTAVWVGQGNADGSFTIPNIPPGNYSLTYWDQNQHYILDFVQVTVNAGEVTDVGIRTLTYWFTKFYGTVFVDNNENGKRDPGEAGVPSYPIVLKDRDNSEIDRMSIAVVTNPDGSYEFEKAYPMGSWMVLEAYMDRYRTTGITFQAWNQPDETTVLGNGVDVDVLPILSQPGRLDWGVKPYAPGANGGIVGTVFYDTMRAEDDARYAGAEPYQPGVPNLTLNLYATVPCGTTAGAACDASGRFELAADGSLAKGGLLNTAVTEQFTRPKNCQARDVDGNPVDFPALPPYVSDPTGPDDPRLKDCLEGPLMGTQFGAEFATLDGNFGFTERADGTPLPAGDYLVEVVIPNDSVLGRPLFQVTREEDVNMYSGDTFVPAVPPPPCAGALHTVDVAGILPDSPDAVDNPGYADAGGSRFEGQQKPLCNVKLISLGNGKSIAPIFTLFTPVPIPGKWKGYIINDLNVDTNPLSLTFGEMAGLQLPIGVYDFTGRLVHTIHSDYHGVYEVLLPSSATTNAPTPSGLLASVYYIYGNDPGQPGALNPDYNPQYRSIGASFEIYTGMITPSDLAPVQNGAQIWSPASQVSKAALCKLDATTPQLFAVSRPYVRLSESQTTRTFTLSGQGFGTSGQVQLGARTMTVVSWNDRQIVVRVPDGTPAGAYQLSVTAANGQRTVNALTIHVLGSGYSPAVFEVGPGRTYNSNNPIYNGTGRGPIQHALDDAASLGWNVLIVVYPGAAAQWNPTGAYFENVVMHYPVVLQGVGPGGVRADGSSVLGSVIDGRNSGGDSPYILWWRQTQLPDIWLNRGGWDGSPVDGEGNPILPEGAVITILARDGEFLSSWRATIDGFSIQGGDQQGFPTNINFVGGGRIPGVTPNVVVQGGGIFTNAYARYLQITNNLIQSNGGAYAGAIRIGTPDVAEPLKDHQNDNVRIANNRILANGGTNLAGAIGLFAGAANYEVAYNDICGNYSAEYGGGVSHYGYSPNGRIHDNRIYFNSAYDEGGGIMIAGELPADFTQLSPGAGPVDIFNNLVQANLGNDDGGGIRFLMAGNFPFNVYNNMIVNNVSAHEGGGLSLNDAPQVRIYNNTIMKNLTTATAMTSNGLPAPAGLSSARNSALLQATLPAGAPIFSNPALFNNIFWDNRAGTKTPQGIAGIGIPGDPNAIFNWDLGVADGSGALNPTYSLLHVPYGDNPTNRVGQNPLVVQQYDTSVVALPWRGNTNMVGVDIVAVDLPVNLMGNYHLQAASPAVNNGAANGAPASDFDNQSRSTPIDIGADELVGGTGGPPPGTPQLYFTTNSNAAPPGLTNGDDADAYSWNGASSYARSFDASGTGSAGLPSAADVDGLARVGTDIYVSFKDNTSVPGVGTVQDEDIVRWNGTAWSLYLNGTATGVGLGSGGEDLDAFDILPNGDLIISVATGSDVPGVTGETTSDLLRCVPTQTGQVITGCTWSMYFDASDISLTTTNEDVDGVGVLTTATGVDIYLSTINSFSTSAPTFTGGGDDVWVCRNAVTGTASSCPGGYIRYFDGSANGLQTHDVDDFNLP